MVYVQFWMSTLHSLEIQPLHDKWCKTIVGEFAAVAAHESVELDVPEVVAHIEKTYDPAGIGLHYPSMYQDLINNHRKTEIDYINGAISRKGRKIQCSHALLRLLDPIDPCQRRCA